MLIQFWLAYNILIVFKTVLNIRIDHEYQPENRINIIKTLLKMISNYDYRLITRNSLTLMVDTISYLYFCTAVRTTIKKVNIKKLGLINWNCQCFNKYIRNVIRVYKIGTRFDLNPSVIFIQLFNLWTFKRDRAHMVKS